MHSKLLAAALLMGLLTTPALSDGHSENTIDRDQAEDREDRPAEGDGEGESDGASGAPGFEMRALYRACLRGKCLRASRNVVLNLRREFDNEEDLNAQFGYVALAVYQSARNSDRRRNQAQVAAVLAGLSRLSTQENQSYIFGEVASAIRRGNTDIFEQENPFQASPTRDRADDRRKKTKARRDALVRALNKRRAVLERRRRAGNG